MRMNSGFRATGIFSRAVLVSRPAFRTERAIVCSVSSLCPVDGGVSWRSTANNGEAHGGISLDISNRMAYRDEPWRTIDVALSRRKHGFDSRWERQLNQIVTINCSSVGASLSNIWPINGREQRRTCGNGKPPHLHHPLATRMITSLSSDRPAKGYSAADSSGGHSRGFIVSVQASQVVD